MGVGCSKPTATEPTATQVADPNANLAMKVELARENAELEAEQAEQAEQDAFMAPHEEILRLLEQLDAEMCELQARIAECKAGNSELAIEQLIKQREILAEKINAGNKKASLYADLPYY